MLHRIIGSFGLSAAAFFICIILIPFAIEAATYFYVTFTMVLLTGVCTALSQNGVYGTAAQLPSMYMQAVNLGAAVAGVAVSVAQILTVWSTSQPGTDNNRDDLAGHLNKSAFYYFLVTFIIMSGAVIIFFAMQKNPFYLYYTTLGSEDNLNPEASNQEEILESALDNYTFQGTSTRSEPSEPQTRTFMDVYRAIDVFAVSLWYNFVVTLALFPAITASIQSVSYGISNSMIYNELFVPLHFLIFNVGDWVGRILANYESFAFKTAKSLAAFSLLRTVFFPLILFSNVIIRDNEQNVVERVFPCLLGNDVVYWLILWIFSVSNGWLCSLITMAAPQTCDLGSKELAGTILVTFLSVGTTMGSLLSFGIRALLCGCNPFIS
jgi:equilibrative nucleoside transporter 1/2/3